MCWENIEVINLSRGIINSLIAISDNYLASIMTAALSTSILMTFVDVKQTISDNFIVLFYWANVRSKHEDELIN